MNKGSSSREVNKKLNFYGKIRWHNLTYGTEINFLVDENLRTEFLVNKSQHLEIELRKQNE